MPNWTAFLVTTAVLTLLLLFLTRLSQRTLDRVVVVDDRDAVPPSRTADEPADPARNAEKPVEGAAVRSRNSGSDLAAPEYGEGSNDVAVSEHGEGSNDVAVQEHGEGGNDVAVQEHGDVAGEAATDPAGDLHGPAVGRQYVTTRALLGNVGVSQGVGLAALVAVAWLTGVPAEAFGLGVGALGADAVAYGLLAGAVLYAANEVAAGVAEQFGFSAPEQLRGMMAPTDAAEWALLLVVVLPIIAVFEEALFRGALIGAAHAGLGVDPWLLAVVSSVAFGFGHGAQGRVGVAVTGVLGFALAALFVITGSLLVVIVAHYVINALEFGVREGLGWEPFGG